MARVLCLAALFALVACDDEVPPRASAMRVESRAQLIGGPKALGQIDDYLLENDKIRVIIHGPGPNRSNTIYGGSIIDADLRRPGGAAGNGNDQMGELLPSFNLEIMNPVSIRVSNDGSDGAAAVVTTEGTGEETYQMMVTLSTALLYPSGLRFREEFRLEPGAQYVKIVSSITNTTSGHHPLPFLNPADADNLFGQTIPELDKIELSVPVGHSLLFGAENQLFAPGAAGFNVPYAIQGSYATARGFPAFPGLVADFLATRGRGVSYGFMVPPTADNYPTAFRHLYQPAQEVGPHSLLIPYVYSAVTGVFTTNPPADIQAGQTFSWTSYFIIGRGDVGSVVDVMHVILKESTGAFGGRVLDARTQAPVAHAMVVILDPAGRVVTELDSDASGAFLGNLAPGAYLYRVVTHVRDTTPAQPFKVVAGATTSVLITLEPPARLAVSIVDERGRAVPCKVDLIGKFDHANLGKDPRTFLYDLRLGEHEKPTTFDRTRDEYIEASWYLADGVLNAEVRPGAYELVVMRGIEYEASRQPVTLAAGGLTVRQVQLERALATPGWVSADLHLHSGNSTDSELTQVDRVVSVAAEGLEYAAATDHNFVTDYAPTIAALGLERWLTATPGLELTTSEMGHFNGFPLKVDPGSVRGGEYRWAGETPDSIFKQMRGLGDDVLIEVNHARDNVLGYFSQFNVDAETMEVVPRDGLRALFAPFKPEFAPSAFSYDFDLLEILNGKRMDLAHHFRGKDGMVVRDAAGRVAYPGQIEDWLTFLARGKIYTATANSDSHHGLGNEPGYPRNLIWVGEGKDEQGAFTTADVMAGLRAHRVIMTNGPMIDLTVDGAPIGALVKCGDSADVSLHVTAASFSPFEKVIIYVNGEPHELAVPASKSRDFAANVTLPLTRDATIVVEVSGSANLFPLLPPQEFEPLNVDAILAALGAGLDLSGLSPGGADKPTRVNIATPLALTNPVWCDRDGNGRFDAPRPPLPARKPSAPEPADVRRAFDAIPQP